MKMRRSTMLLLPLLLMCGALWIFSSFCSAEVNIPTAPARYVSLQLCDGRAWLLIVPRSPLSLGDLRLRQGFPPQLVACGYGDVPSAASQQVTVWSVRSSTVSGLVAAFWLAMWAWSRWKGGDAVCAFGAEHRTN